MPGNWKQVLIERLINHKYTFTTAGGFQLHHSHGGPPTHLVFNSKEEHRSWFYATDPPAGHANFKSIGLRNFDRNSGVGTGRSPVEESVHAHGGIKPLGNKEAAWIDDAVEGSSKGDNQAKDPLFGINDLAEDVFMAVRAKLDHVYNEGREDGCGLALAVMRTFYGDIVAGSTGDSFDAMLKAVDAFAKIADGMTKKGLKTEADAIRQHYEKYKSKGCDSHDSW